jgi:hypothetical protein
LNFISSINCMLAKKSLILHSNSEFTENQVKYITLESDFI